MKESEIFNEVKKFIASPLKNGYITDGVMTLYVRKSRQLIQGEIKRCFDLANVTVSESEQGKGIFKKFMHDLLVKFPNLNIYVESVLSDAVAHVIKDLGFTKQSDNNFDNNYYKLGK